MTDSEVPQLTLLQISDLHFGPPYVEKVGAAVLEIAPHLNPDAIIVSGDLTQRAKREQFEAAKAFLAMMPSVPQLVIPGNHDVPLYRLYERMTNPHGLYKEIITPDLNPVLRIRSAVIAGLDSTAPHTAISNGRIFKSQLDNCARIFDEAPEDAIRIVVAHHHFAPAPDYLNDSIMPKAKRAMERFADLRVELILGGHLHRLSLCRFVDYLPMSPPDCTPWLVILGGQTSAMTDCCRYHLHAMRQASRCVRGQTSSPTHLVSIC